MASDTRLCSLEAAVGRDETCPQDACPFWDAGGMHCAFEQLDVAADATLATWLLEIRARLAAGESTAAADEAHTLFSHLLNESAE